MDGLKYSCASVNFGSYVYIRVQYTVICLSDIIWYKKIFPQGISKYGEVLRKMSKYWKNNQSLWVLFEGFEQIGIITEHKMCEHFTTEPRDNFIMSVRILKQDLICIILQITKNLFKYKIVSTIVYISIFFFSFLSFLNCFFF